MLKIVRLSIAIILALPMMCSAADVVHVRDYRTHEPGDRGVLFGMAIAPNSDVLTLAAKGSGKWRLTRIRGWDEKSASDQTIDVPGWEVKKGAADNPDLVMATLLVSGDGRYAICDAHAFWPDYGHRGGRFDDLVSVIDLDRFQVLKTVHATNFGVGPWSLSVAASGYLVLQSEISLPADDNGRLHLSPMILRPDGSPSPAVSLAHDRKEMVLLSLPDLSGEDRCHFSQTLRPDVFAVKDEDCATLVQRATGNSTDLKTFLEKLEPNGLRMRNTAQPPCVTQSVTRDGRFELQSCETHHLTAFNRNFVLDSSAAQIVASDDGKLIGAVNLTIHNSVADALAATDGRNYFLVVEAGTKLKVYEIRP